MIKAVLKKNGTISFKVSGHAEYAPKGSDIICAAASILLYALAAEVVEMDCDGKLEEKPRIRLENGDAAVECRPRAEFYSEAEHYFKLAETGFSILEHEYPACAELKTVC